MKVTDIKTEDLRPAIRGYDHLLPDRLFAERMNFTIHGVSNAVSNGLRRVISCEIPVYAFTCEYSDIITNNPFIIPEVIIARLKLIPIDQNTPSTATYELIYTNNTLIQVDVKSSQITGHGRLPCNGNITLFTMDPGQTITIRNIKLELAYGYTSSYGGHVLACNVLSRVKDVTPINVYTGEGTTVSTMNAKVWEIQFITNGTMPAGEIVAYACDVLVERILAVKELLGFIETNKDEHVLVVKGESDTIGNLFMKTINELYPDIGYVVYTTSNIERELTLRVKCNEDITQIYETAITYIVETYRTIKLAF
jgi:DNA-directed RNA polymerase subunit L